MVDVRNKELLGSDSATLKLREAVESRHPYDYGGNIVPDHKSRPPESEWVVSIEKKLEQGRKDLVPGSWAKLSIYWIPCYLKNGENKAWVPQIVSLGPYHHGEEHLRPMDRHKWRCLRHILDRSNHKIGLYLDSVREVEGKARACYEGMLSMSQDEFVEMMVLDGCFVIELFRGFIEGFEKLGYPAKDPLFSMRESILRIQQDMIMLENQIPLFILDLLLGLQLGNLKKKWSVAPLAIRFFDSLGPNSSTFPRWNFDQLSDHGSVHCLEVFWRSLLPLDPMPSETKEWPRSWKQFIPCLTELRDIGIKIRLRYTDDWRDIKFENRILWIPQLVVHEGTRSLLFNLIAFEQCHFDCSNYITSYVVFMRNLINSPEDVRYLRNNRIIVHCLGSDAEVAALFHRLCQGVPFNMNDSYLYALAREVERQCLNRYSRIETLYIRFNQWKVILKRKHFANPWSIISLIAAFALLVLTFIQALYAVYGYYKVGS